LKNIKVGIVLNTQYPMHEDPATKVKDTIEQVEVARDCGFDSVWVVQHFLATPYQMLQQMPLLGRLTAVSGDMQIGSGIFQLTLSNPVYAAEQALTLDALAEGRFVFGVGLGFRDEEFRAFGVDPKRRVSRFEECFEVMHRLWTEQSVTHHGKHFDLDDATVLLKSTQHPQPPVWVAGSGDPAVRRAARFGVPWLINPHATLRTVERQMGVFRETLDEAKQKAPDVVPIFRELAIGSSHEQALSGAAPYLSGKYAAYAEWGLDKPMPDDESLMKDLEELVEDRFIVGSGDECLEQLAHYVERIGANHFLLRVDWPGMAQKAVLRQFELLAEHVLPGLAAL
jgi:alkanesulfonate monooxygenase SsuD/methylene tetrahydromethanopterin reductase-like flavin-dependent oxidoreductase (luciferase family)